MFANKRKKDMKNFISFFVLLLLYSCSQKKDAPQSDLPVQPISSVADQANEVKEDAEHTGEGFTYQAFKQKFQKATLQLGEPFLLDDRLLQDWHMQVFFPSKSSDMILYFSTGKILKSIQVSISGSKTNNIFDDLPFALAAIYTLEGFSTVKEANDFLDKILSLPDAEEYNSPSGFSYMHPTLTENTIMFFAEN